MSSICWHLSLVCYNYHVIYNTLNWNEENMTIKSFERPLMELSHDLVYKHAKFIDNEYKLDIAELNSVDKLEFIQCFININNNLDSTIQEYLTLACQDRMYAESDPFGARHND